LPALITLTTDFGTGSPYVAAMKGVVLARCPGATLVDISHEVPPFDIEAGAFMLWAGSRHFPAGAVHLAVVDPGVGGSRRAVAVAVSGSTYVGPDNGVFGLVLSGAGRVRAVELERPAGASPTFEGRDVFAPAAAGLACGQPLAALGRPATGLRRGAPGRPHRVVWIDRFGNLITSIRPPVSGLRMNGREVLIGARTFAEAPGGEPFFYTGSLGLVEIGVPGGRADQLLAARRGDRVEPVHS
jgi:S-adenosylmethionine hydrolase